MSDGNGRWARVVGAVDGLDPGAGQIAWQGFKISAKMPLPSWVRMHAVDESVLVAHDCPIGSATIDVFCVNWLVSRP